MSIKIMLDSGAFSIWKRGGEIDLEDYIDFCLENREGIWQAVNLDVIPGKPGHRRTSAQVEEAAKQGWRNSKRMRKRGVEPIPVFHQGERLYWLEKMVGEGFRYIGLSPNKSLATGGKIPWLDQCWDYLAGIGGFPTVKLHAFGEAAFRILFRYPWFSVDSTSWILIGANGQIMVPGELPDGSYDFLTKPFQVSVSQGIAPRGKNKPRPRGFFPDRIASAAIAKQGNDLRTLGPETRDYVLRYLKHIGFTEQELATDDKARKRANIRFLQRMAAQYRQAPYRVRAGALARVGPDPIGTDRWPFKPNRLTFVFVSGITVDNCWMVTVENSSHSLMSYYDMADGGKRSFDLVEYSKRGLAYIEEWKPGVFARVVGNRRTRNRL